MKAISTLPLVLSFRISEALTVSYLLLRKPTDSLSAVGIHLPVAKKGSHPPSLAAWPHQGFVLASNMLVGWLAQISFPLAPCECYGCPVPMEVSMGPGWDVAIVELIVFPSIHGHNNIRTIRTLQCYHYNVLLFSFLCFFLVLSLFLTSLFQLIMEVQN